MLPDVATTVPGGVTSTDDVSGRHNVQLGPHGRLERVAVGKRDAQVELCWPAPLVTDPLRDPVDHPEAQQPVVRAGPSGRDLGQETAVRGGQVL